MGTILLAKKTIRRFELHERVSKRVSDGLTDKSVAFVVTLLSGWYPQKSNARSFYEVTQHDGKTGYNLPFMEKHQNDVMAQCGSTTHNNNTSTGRYRSKVWL